MSILTMSMVRNLDHFYFNPSNLYMAVIMVAAMAVLMVVGTCSMLKNTRLNIVLLVGCAGLPGPALSSTATRPGGSEGFLKSMIPHHCRAILVCRPWSITDPKSKNCVSRSWRPSSRRSPSRTSDLARRTRSRMPGG